MIKLPLSKGKHTIIDDDDFDRISKYKWHYSDAGRGYAKRGVHIKIAKGKYKVITILLHRFIANVSDCWEIDHINRNSLDNRKCNLRIATRLDNLMNRECTKNMNYKFSHNALK